MANGLMITREELDASGWIQVPSIYGKTRAESLADAGFVHQFEACIWMSDVLLLLKGGDHELRGRWASAPGADVKTNESLLAFERHEDAVLVRMLVNG